MTPSSSSPVRSTSTDVVLVSRRSGSCSQGSSGTPRHDCTRLPFDDRRSPGRCRALGALPAERGDRPRMGQQQPRFAAPGEQLVEVVGGRRTGAGVDALLEVGVVQQPEVAVVDQLVLLPFAQRLDGQPQLLLGLVHRVVVEVGHPGVHAQDRLRDAQLVLPRRRVVVDERARAASSSPAWPEASAISASPFLFCAGCGRCRTSSRWARSDSERSISSLKRCRVRRRTVHRVSRLGGVLPEVLRRLESAAARRGSRRRPTSRGRCRRRTRRRRPWLTLPWAISTTSSTRLPNSRSPVPGSYSSTSNRSASALQERPRRRSSRSGGSSVSSGRDHPDVGAGDREAQPAVADREGGPPVHPVRAALGLHPGQHPQQPARARCPASAARTWWCVASCRAAAVPRLSCGLASVSDVVTMHRPVCFALAGRLGSERRLCQPSSPAERGLRGMWQAARPRRTGRSPGARRGSRTSSSAAPRRTR